ncbi:hypothetical protein [Massiliimalia timonensis]|uniref:hypothetical protein n=1 Tax=Massiliimalia timonensis TaxID=1987501 RepID=UPI00189DC963|nr:hypothetical protein [Massiliimalia timonensis]
MKRFYVFKDGMQQGSMSSKEEAIELIRRRQKRETHPILRSEYSIIEGVEEFIPYLTQLEQPKKKREMER